MGPHRRGADLHLDDAALARLAARWGTPLFAYSERKVLSQLEAYRKAFHGLDPLITYAFKANSNGALVRLLARAGAGAEVVSGGELWRARRAGFPASKITFSGVGKTDAELELALKEGILYVTLESEEEALRLRALARRRNKTADVAVRVNPDVAAKTHRHITTGTAANKFGVPAPAARRIAALCGAGPGLRLVGLHQHLGSQIRTAAPYVRGLRALLRLRAEFASAGHPVTHLDAGGGWAVPDDGSTVPVARLAAALRPLLRGVPARLTLEPGRFLVAEAGVLLTRVLYRKRAGRKHFVIVDAAMTDFIRPSLYDAAHPVVPVRARRGRAAAYDVVGPVCESTDFLAKNVRGPLPEPGDLLAVLRAGAYGMTMASQYNSRPRAAEVLVRGARARLARRRETWADLVRAEV